MSPALATLSWLLSKTSYYEGIVFILCYFMSDFFLLLWVYEFNVDWNNPRNVLNGESDSKVLFWSDYLKEFWSIILQQR